MDRRTMRDMARRRMGITSRRMRDMRNPYGSRGGYVRDSRMGRDMRGDYRGRDYNYGNDYLSDNEVYGYREHPTLYDNVEREQLKYEKSNPDGGYDYGYDAGSYYPFDVRGSFSRYDARMDRRYDYARGRDRRYDYASGNYLDEDELMDWQDDLMEQLDEKDKQLLKKDMIMKKAMEMGVKYNKFNEDEFYTTVLMLYSDYKNSLGSSNVDMYLKLAKDWLEDKDAEVQGGEKLAAYYESVVAGM